MSIQWTSVPPTGVISNSRPNWYAVPWRVTPCGERSMSLRPVRRPHLFDHRRDLRSGIHDRLEVGVVVPKECRVSGGEVRKEALEQDLFASADLLRVRELDGTFHRVLEGSTSAHEYEHGESLRHASPDHGLGHLVASALQSCPRPSSSARKAASCRAWSPSRYCRCASFSTGMRPSRRSSCLDSTSRMPFSR